MVQLDPPSKKNQTGLGKTDAGDVPVFGVNQYPIWSEPELQKRNLKELTEGHHQEWSLWLNLTQHGKSHQARTLEGLTD
jgi:hypothetical protein